jgi:hypothetical protein
MLAILFLNLRTFSINNREGGTQIHRICEVLQRFI